MTAKTGTETEVSEPAVTRRSKSRDERAESGRLRKWVSGTVEQGVGAIVGVWAWWRGPRPHEYAGREAPRINFDDDE